MNRGPELPTTSRSTGTGTLPSVSGAYHGREDRVESGSSGPFWFGLGRGERKEQKRDPMHGTN
ncbi:hypothetical protein EYZ11_001761 [Aspergillus tanneri]|uniref:Uncharacterized protein n=1 Tax=Aspergillus tanneri TaxID=1220188 RepID=A0A4S3JSM3_9EURO|nr:hypothetical protein EYZ11_001761 [Aspergillus tanneri]